MIRMQYSFLVVGGGGNYKTESCELYNGNMVCTEQDPVLKNYAYYPELFAVTDNYCK